MIYDNHLFKVIAGSKYNINISSSLSSSEVTNRKKYEMNGAMNNGVILKDIIFTSASSAAKQIVGYSVNGKNVWKRKDGLTIGKYMEQF